MTSATADPGLEALETTARRGLWWSVANNVVGRVGTTLIGIVLARILAPDDYGVYAIALVVLNISLSMNELGVSLAVVRWPADVDRIAPTVATLSLLFSALLWLAIFATAPLVASALGASEATGVVRVLSLAILIDAATAVPAALMTREFMQRERLIVDLAGFVVTSAVAVCLAVAGAGAWALAVGALLGNLVNGIFVFRYAPRRHRPGWNRAVAGELLRFGLPLAAASLLLIALLEVDYVVVGAELGATALGFYLLAFNLSTWPVNMFSTPARRVSLPLFAKLDAGATDASAAFVPVCSLLLLVTLPACLVLALFAEPLIRIVYGAAWEPSAAVLPWLTVLALTRVIGELVYDFLVALDEPRKSLALQAVWLLALLVVLPVAVRAGGIVGVAVGHAVVAVVVVMPSYAIVLRSAGVSLRGLAASVLRPLAGGLLAGVAAGAVALLVSGRLVQLAAGGAVVLLVYLAAVYPMRSMLRSPLTAGARAAA